MTAATLLVVELSATHAALRAELTALLARAATADLASMFAVDGLVEAIEGVIERLDLHAGVVEAALGRSGAAPFDELDRALDTLACWRHEVAQLALAVAAADDARRLALGQELRLALAGLVVAHARHFEHLEAEVLPALAPLVGRRSVE